MKKRVLIIGSSGMLGRDLAHELRSGYEVCGADIAGSGKSIKKFYSCDITKKKNVADVIMKARPDIVILTAAWTDVDGCERDPKKAYRVNADGAWHVALTCKTAGLPLIFISTDFVFNGRKRSLYRETDRTSPLSVYGDSKLQGEHAVRTALKEHIIVRTSWLYGVHGKNFVDTIVAKGKIEPRLRVVDDQVGSPTSTIDLSRALRKLTDLLTEDPEYGTFHVSNAGKVSWYGYAREILRLAGLKTRVEPISSRELDRPAKRPALSELDCSKLKKMTGMRMRPWKAALSEYIQN